MTRSVWAYIFTMAIVSYLLRVLPITLIRKQITNPFIKSLLFYLPYVTLSVMTVPSIFFVSENVICGVGALVISCLVAYKTSNLFMTAVTASVVVFLLSLI
ncbi:MAG: AzlD domain-containing protein [Erysipelotrichaceae bacterium]|nr:AzlD domain-containing protein [Erysipelotrichaceae bacterium]